MARMRGKENSSSSRKPEGSLGRARVGEDYVWGCCTGRLLIAVWSKGPVPWVFTRLVGVRYWPT